MNRANRLILGACAMPPLRGQAPRQIMGTKGPFLPSCLVSLALSRLVGPNLSVRLRPVQGTRLRVSAEPVSYYDRGLPELHSQ